MQLSWSQTHKAFCLLTCEKIVNKYNLLTIAGNNDCQLNWNIVSMFTNFIFFNFLFNPTYNVSVHMHTCVFLLHEKKIYRTENAITDNVEMKNFLFVEKIFLFKKTEFSQNCPFILD